MHLPKISTTRALTAAAAVTILIPVILYPRPPVLDFANHAARIWLMNGGLGNPALSAAYASDWTNIASNIGIDLLAVVISPLIGAWNAARLALALSVLTPALGLIALNARHAGKLTWWSVALPVFAWTCTAIYGFLNFQIGMGLALLAAAADATLARRGVVWAAGGRAACCAVVLLFHPFAAAFYAALLGALSLGPALKALRNPMAYVKALAAAAPALIVLVLWILLSPRLPLANFPVAETPSLFSFDPVGAAIRLATPLLTYHTYNNLADLALILLIASACAALMLTRRASIHAGLALLALGFAAATAFVPSFLDGTDINVRTGIMMALSAAAAFSPNDKTAQWTQAAALAALTLVAARTAWIGVHWHRAQADVAAVEAVLADVPAGAAVLVLARSPTDEGRDSAPIGRYFRRHQSAYWHYGAYAVIDRAAFVPTLFAADSQQPLRVRAPYLDISSPLGCYMVPAQTLYDPALAASEEGLCAPYVRLWRERFDYFLLLNTDERFDLNGPFTPPDSMRLQRDAGFVRLYRVDRAAAPS